MDQERAGQHGRRRKFSYKFYATSKSAVPSARRKSSPLKIPGSIRPECAIQVTKICRHFPFAPRSARIFTSFLLDVTSVFAEPENCAVSRDSASGAPLLRSLGGRRHFWHLKVGLRLRYNLAQFVHSSG
jgi:hypothetical protein